MKSLLLILFFCMGVVGSQGQEKQSPLQIPLQKSDSTVSSLASVAGGKLTVILFYSETCPICQKYTLSLRAMSEKYTAQGIRFVLIFPDTATVLQDVRDFASKYKIPFPMFVDKRQELTSALAATITPEAIVLSPLGKTLYKGRIDNLFEGLGKMRRVVTKNELQNALDEILANKPVSIKETKAIGCIIEKIGE